MNEEFKVGRHFAKYTALNVKLKCGGLNEKNIEKLSESMGLDGEGAGK